MQRELIWFAINHKITLHYISPESQLPNNILFIIPLALCGPVNAPSCATDDAVMAHICRRSINRPFGIHTLFCCMLGSAALTPFISDTVYLKTVYFYVYII